MFVKVTTLPDGAHQPDNAVPVLVLLGPGCMVVPVTERGVKGDFTKLVFPNGRAVVLAHSMTFMEALIMGDVQRKGLASDIDRQLASTGKQ